MKRHSALKNHAIFLNKALITGVINSLIGYAIIFTLIFLGMEPMSANFSGYCGGLVIAFKLNKYWVINNRAKDSAHVWRFIFAFAISYSISLMLLYIFIYIMNIDKYWAQLLSGAAYFVVFLSFNRLYVFKQ